MFTLLRGFKTTHMTPTLRNLLQYYYSGEHVLKDFIRGGLLS